MNKHNYVIVGLIIFILFLGYQVIELKQYMNTINDVPQPQITSLGTNADGFWLYKDDERTVYFFKFDPKTNEVIKVVKNLYSQ